MDNLDFKSAKQIGRAEELKIMKTLEKRGLEVWDLTAAPEYQKKDIDFLIQWNDGVQAYIEVKADRRIGQTNNMCIELITNEQTGANGWFSYCKADYIFYSDIENNLCYCFLLDDLKKYFKDKRNEICERRIIERTKSRVLALVNVNDFYNYLKGKNLYFQVLNLEV